MPLGPICYHMSYTLLALTNAAGGPIRMRLTLLGELLSDVAAKASALKGTTQRTDGRTRRGRAGSGVPGTAIRADFRLQHPHLRQIRRV